MYFGFQLLLNLKVPFYKIEHSFALIFVKSEKLNKYKPFIYIYFVLKKSQSWFLFFKLGYTWSSLVYQ